MNTAVVKLADTTDLKSVAVRRVGSTPTCGIRYYKVVDKQLASKVIHGMYSVYYEVNQWAQASDFSFCDGYHLLVFDDLEAARHFRNVEGGLLFECEIQEIMTLQPYLDPDNLDYRRYPGSHGWPDHTVMVKSVKLLEEVV